MSSTPNSTARRKTSRSSGPIAVPIICLLILMAAFCLQTAWARGNDASGADNATRVVVLGDSIGAAYGIAEAEGWVNLMAEHLNQAFGDVVVHNASLSGETTGGGLQRLPRILEQISPDIVIIELGGNDGLRGQSVKQMAINLTAMVDLARSYGAETLLLGMRIPSNYGPAYTEKFASTYTQVAAETGAAIVPFLLEPIALQQEYFLPDGVHPSQQAQVLLFEHMRPAIENLLTKIRQ